ncbi:hypothetical protein KUV59_14445 [Marinobacter daepoensis]|uniref:hypothetical protein n=1 Tax=Marinobacter daepoensis TaxID=262077 RepID=UPI001C975E69|nr:hypothetical protein [Marinobacter daepoensis]MBY6034378.1 hypothetical protein [Marinobacter daepoensis]
MKKIFVFCVFLFLVACKSNSSDDDQPDVGIETIAPEVGTWIRACSPLDDVITSEIFDDAELSPAWWVERLEITENRIVVTRSVYADDMCETPLSFGDEFGMDIQCFGQTRESILVQGTYDVLSFPYIDDSGIPDVPEGCDLASEPGMNVYPVGDLLYRAYYMDAMNMNPSELVVDFNEVFERVE